MSLTTASQPPTSANVVLGTAADGSAAEDSRGCFLAVGLLVEAEELLTDEVGEGARLPFRESVGRKAALNFPPRYRVIILL